MHSVYHEPTSPFNAEDFELSEDDQFAVARLYGQRKIKMKSKTTETTTSKRIILPPNSSLPAKQLEKEEKKDDTPPDLCKIEDQLKTFLVIVKLEDNRYGGPKIIG
ncbi:hypothetical protein FQA39_LY14947 [Lamprigera yunnana]|nr:hypothetical protein FQA39_LY14947 [Lamprigera yunnana]